MTVKLIYVKMEPRVWMALMITSMCSMIKHNIISAKTRHLPNAGLTLGQRLSLWPSMTPTLGERLLFYSVAIKG